MYAGCVKAATEVWGKGVQSVLDRFHGATLYRRGWDK
jgi:hypothetical protein